LDGDCPDFMFLPLIGIHGRRSSNTDERNRKLGVGQAGMDPPYSHRPEKERRMSDQPVFLTKEGYKKLEEELELLRTKRRAEVAERLHDAMEGGELIENAEYESAKNEQAFVEGRILTLETMLSNAIIIEEGGPQDIVRVGSKVTIQESNNPPEQYVIVGAAEANPKEGRISNQSPLGQSLLGRKAGDEVRVTAPAGILTFRVLSVK
jgi:transcription elongation factor GreA